MNRFELTPIVSPADPQSTAAQIIDLRGSAQAGLNTLNDEANLRSFLLHGVGRVEGCVLTRSDTGILRLPNGWFLAGSGEIDTEAEGYFPGARLVSVNAVAGYIELTGNNAPPASATSYGHMSISGAVVWANAPLVTTDGKRPGARWLIGKVVTDANGAVTSVDATIADVVGRPLSSGSGEGEGPIDVPIYGDQLKWSQADPRPLTQVIEERLQAIEAEVAKANSASNIFPAPFDILADEIALNRAGIAEVNPPSIERGQISVVVINAGMGQDDGPNFSPTTGDPLELAWDANEGTFG